MSRLIFLFAVAAVVYWLLKSYLKQPPEKAAPESSEDMVQCCQCGVNLPKSESILARGEYFCSQAHLRERTEQRK
jgi:uncharacterized protein